MKKVVLFAIALIHVNLLFSQVDLLSVKTIPFYSGGEKLDLALVGGLNNPQFSNFDFNGDGVKDLYIFDRNAEKSIVLLNEGKTDTLAFQYSPKYQNYFPYLQEHALIRDFNCDGIPDIFTRNIGVPGIRVWKGYYDAGGLSFAMFEDVITYKSGIYYPNINPLRQDVPEYIDVDNDGDLDIFCFDSFIQGYVVWYKNYSMENTGTCDTLAYLEENRCWGNFVENTSSNDLVLGISCKGGGAASDTLGSPRHAGGTVCMFDRDNDGDKEIVMGDLSYNSVVIGYNTGTPDYGDITTYENGFPAYDTPVDVPVFVATFSVDVNNDGANDLLFAPNTINASNSNGNVALYKNDANLSNQLFHKQTDSFLVGDMVDLGESSYPVFFDANGDGLMDIISGSYGFWNRSDGLIHGNVYYYENTGNDTLPEYQLMTDNYMNLSDIGAQAKYTAFGDIDNDGDQDLFVGDENGAVHLFFNVPDVSGAANFRASTPVMNLASIDVGQMSKPCLFDFDDDGDLDMLIGRQDGKLSYFKNYGTPSVYAFSMDSSNHFFGNINITGLYSVDGMSQPGISQESSENDTLYLFVATEEGIIKKYGLNADSLMSGTLPLLDSNFHQIDEGRNLTLSIADINADGKFEYLLGNIRGGFTMFSENTDWDSIYKPDTVLSVKSVEQKLDLDVYPNPCQGKFNVYIAGDLGNNLQLEVLNLMGQAVATQEIHKGSNLIELPNIAKGVWVVRVMQSGKLLSVKKVVSF